MTQIKFIILFTFRLQLKEDKIVHQKNEFDDNKIT